MIQLFGSTRSVMEYPAIRYGPVHGRYRPSASFIALRSSCRYQFPLLFCNRQITGIKDPLAAPRVICFPYHLRFHPWKQTPSKSYSPCII